MFLKSKRWVLLSILMLLLASLSSAFYYIHDQQHNLYDKVWHLGSKNQDGEMTYDTYFITKKFVYRTIGEGHNQSLVVYNILSQDGYDYRVAVTNAHVHPEHSHMLPGDGYGTLTIIKVKDNTLFIAHKIKNKMIEKYYSAFYHQ